MDRPEGSTPLGYQEFAPVFSAGEAEGAFRSGKSSLDLLSPVSLLIFVFSFPVAAYVLAGSTYVPGDIGWKFLFQSLLWGAAFLVCHSTPEFGDKPVDKSLMLAVFGAGMAGALAMYQWALLPGGLFASAEGTDSVRYEYWGMYLADVWRTEGSAFIPMPFPQPGIVYLWGLIYRFFAYDPHLTVMMNGFLFASTGLVTYTLASHIIPHPMGGRLSLLIYLALADGWEASLGSRKDLLVAFLVAFGLLQSWKAYRGGGTARLVLVALASLVLLTVRQQMGLFLIFCAMLVLMGRRAMLVRVLVALLPFGLVLYFWQEILVETIYQDVTSEAVGFIPVPDPDQAQPGSAQWALGGKVTPANIHFLPLHMLAVISQGGVTLVWRMGAAFRDYLDLYLIPIQFVSGFFLTVLFPLVVAEIAAGLRERTDSAVLAIMFIVGLAALTVWLGGSFQPRYRTFLFPIFSVLSARQMLLSPPQRRFWLLAIGLLILLAGGLGYEYVKGEL